MLAAPYAQQETLPSARLISAPRLAMPGAVDSNVPMTWELVEGSWRLFAFTSWGGIPALLSGAALDQMRQVGPVTIIEPGHGIWIESIVPDDTGAWYAYYHHERAADGCGRPDRSIPRIGSARSTDRGDYPAGTPLVLVSQPWHDGNEAADAFWGPSVHWNPYLERYVMLLNRAKASAPASL